MSSHTVETRSTLPRTYLNGLQVPTDVWDLLRLHAVRHLGFDSVEALFDAETGDDVFLDGVMDRIVEVALREHFAREDARKVAQLAANTSN